MRPKGSGSPTSTAAKARSAECPRPCRRALERAAFPLGKPPHEECVRGRWTRRRYRRWHRLPASNDHRSRGLETFGSLCIPCSPGHRQRRHSRPTRIPALATPCRRRSRWARWRLLHLPHPAERQLAFRAANSCSRCIQWLSFKRSRPHAERILPSYTMRLDSRKRKHRRCHRDRSHSLANGHIAGLAAPRTG